VARTDEATIPCGVEARMRRDVTFGADPEIGLGIFVIRFQQIARVVSMAF